MPNVELLPYVDKKVKEYDFNYAIHLHGPDIKIYPDIFAYMAGDLNVDDLGGTPLLTVRDIALRGWRLSLKRGLDIFGALFGLIFLSPILLLVAVIIRLDSPGSPFYSQIRMGLDGRPFPIIKFRTMRQDAESK
ncbi:MAG: sugar transferase, partial [Anaerolineae bacterium]|nr:sugar transferase [Anaerolineae bacterium]